MAARQFTFDPQDLGHDAELREALSLTLPVVPATIVSDDGDGLYTIQFLLSGSTDGVQAWAVNHVVYSVDDVVWVAFINDNPESGVILGARTGARTPDHASTHVGDGDDLLDGDHLDIDYTPTNYTPDDSPAEAADVDDLAAHLKGIDTAIGGKADDDHNHAAADITSGQLSPAQGGTGVDNADYMLTIPGTGTAALRHHTPVALDPTLHLPFDGPAPYNTDFTGIATGHRGQAATVTGGVIYRPGKFGKAVQVAEASTNMALNPVAGTSGNIAAAGSATATTASTAKPYIWSTSLKLDTTAAANDGLVYTLSALTNAVHYVTIRTDVVWITQEWSLDNTNWSAPTLLSSDDNGWYVYGLSFVAAQANGSTALRIRQSDATARTVHIGHVQVEAKAYATPPVHGSLGTGHSWSGTAHASTSSRTAAHLAYPQQANASEGTVMAWLRFDGFNSSTLQMSADIAGTGNAGLALFRHHTTGAFRLQYGDGSATQTAPSTTLPVVGNWYHVAVTWSPAGGRIYVNGVLEGSNNTAPAISLTANMTIGRQENSAIRWMNGLVDEFAILPYAADAATIAAIYESNASLHVSSTGDPRLIGDYALTLPATGTAALLATAQTFTAAQTIDQSSTTAAEPVLVLDQGDVDQDFVELVGGSSTGNATSISTDAAGAYAGRLQITVNGTRRWINFYADA